MTERTRKPHIDTGARGEEAALDHLAARGFVIRTRNWRPAGLSRRLELDLIGEWEAHLVFVEVKARRARTADPSDIPAGLFNFTPAKRQNMVRAAGAYLAESGLWDHPCRFDLVCVTFLPGKPPLMDHYRNVIELGQTLDRRDTAWQPW